jgi:predicted aspartyl protease
MVSARSVLDGEAPAMQKDVIPFRLSRGAQGPLPLVSVCINDEGPFTFVFDTGAGPTLIAPALASRLKIPLGRSREGQGIVHKATVSVAEVQSVAMGTRRSGPMSIVVSEDVGRIGTVIDEHLDGILGYSFLRNYDLLIDYGTRELRLFSPSVNVEMVGGVSIPFRLPSSSKPLLMVTATISDQGPIQFAIDTGASATAISGPIARRLQAETSDSSRVTGAGGTADISLSIIKRIDIGGVRVAALRAAVVPSLEQLSHVVGTEIDGILGYDFLRQFRVLIRFGAGLITLQSLP